ncbi:MAG: GNAT family N-acetyltransferase [Beijerinckiaceae bacterium]|nr:GNAT family N-acetyltransferase [Beijerinckiaceae bacterium]
MQQDGYTLLDPQKLAALVTYLVHDLETVPPEPVWPEDFVLERLNGAAIERYRTLFSAVGAEWLWFSRLRMPDLALWEILMAPAVEVYALVRDGKDVGLLELDFRDAEAPELAFFGVVPDALGQGIGKRLMATALQRASVAGMDCLHVHTCSLDHPRALDFYCRAGFRPIRRAIEVFDDPRLDGTLPRDAAPWLPLLEP